MSVTVLSYIICSTWAVSFAFCILFCVSSMMLMNECPDNILFCEGKGIALFNFRG